MSGIYLLASILCLAIGGSVAQIIEGNYNVTAVCTAVKPGTQLGSIVSCDYYYVCTQNGPVQTNCPSGYSYNYKAQSCSPSTGVSCFYGLANPCQGKIGDNWVPVVGTCNKWVYCKNAVASGTGSCGNLIFNPTTQVCNYGTCSESPTSGPNLVNLCEVIPPQTYFGSMTDCATYNYCYADGTLGTGTCTTGAFDVQSDTCGYVTSNNCDRITEAPVPNRCTVSGQKLADNRTCGSFYICENSVYNSMSCGNGLYFDVPSQQCVPRKSATPADGCNRCQYARTSFVNAVDTEYCNEYYYCNNGVNGNTLSCPAGYFFDEASQGCFPYADLSSYALNNGACHGAVTPPTTTAASEATTAKTTVETTTETTAKTTAKITTN